MVSIEMQLDNELKRELKYIESRIVGKATKAALKKIAKPVLDTMKEEVPTKTYMTKQNLCIVAENTKSGAVAYVGLAKKSTDWFINVRGLSLEYGNIIIKEPNPFVLQTEEQHREPVFNDFKKYLNQHLDKLLR